MSLQNLNQFPPKALHASKNKISSFFISIYSPDIASGVVRFGDPALLSEVLVISFLFFPPKGYFLASELTGVTLTAALTGLADKGARQLGNDSKANKQKSGSVC